MEKVIQQDIDDLKKCLKLLIEANQYCATSSTLFDILKDNIDRNIRKAEQIIRIWETKYKGATQ
jgi:hypothetical protein